VLIFAKPAVFSFSEIAGNNPMSVAIVIDNSFSMGFQDNFERAKKRAEELVESIPDGSFTIIAPLVGDEHGDENLTANRKELRGAVRNIKLSNSFTDNVARLQDIYSGLQKSPIEDKKVFLITDFQKNGWSSENFTSPWLELIDISGISEPSNHAVSDTLVNYEGGTVKIKSHVSNFSDKPVTELLTTARLGSEEVREHVDIKPQDSSIVEVGIKINQLDKPLSGSVETSHDELKIDDVRYYIEDSKSESGILIIDGDPREDSRLSETYYLARALETIYENSSTAVTILDNDSLLNEDLSIYSMLFLANVGEITPESAVEIERFVKNGGGLVIFLGNRVRAGTYNALLGKLMPGELLTLTGGNILLAPEDSEIFSKDIKEKINQISTEQIYKIRQNPGSEILIRDSEINPFLLKGNYGKGHVFVFTSTADTAWSNFSITPVFLPIIKRILELPDIEKNNKRHYFVNESVNIEVPDDSGATAIKNPAGLEYELKRGTSEFAETRLPGIYTVIADGEPSYNFAVNIDPAESDLEKISAQSIEKDKGQEGIFVKVFREIWSYFLWGAVALFISESAFRAIFT
jgi:hypothetical protein